MKILALETSAKSVSVAVTEDGVPLASSYQNTGLTHSRTLMPLLDAMLTSSGLELQDMDALAVAAGPGSFTGLRIGVSALKGLAWAAEKPCCGVSTLETMARNLAHMDALIVCAMDARRNQVYNALFRARGGALERLTPDRAIGIEELAKELADISAETGKIVVGDGGSTESILAYWNGAFPVRSPRRRCGCRMPSAWRSAPRRWCAAARRRARATSCRSICACRRRSESDSRRV